MTYIPSYYLKDIIGNEAYSKLLKFGNGCMIYVSKKELRHSENAKEYQRLIKSGLTPKEALKILSKRLSKPLRIIKKWEQKGKLNIC